MKCELCKESDNNPATYIASGVGDNGENFSYHVCVAHADMAMVVGWEIKSLPTQAAPDAGRAEVASGQVIPPAQVS